MSDRFRWLDFLRKVWQVLGLGPRYGITFVLPSSNTMAAIGKLMAEGKLKAVIDRVLPFEEARYVVCILAFGLYVPCDVHCKLMHVSAGELMGFEAVCNLCLYSSGLCCLLCCTGVAVKSSLASVAAHRELYARSRGNFEQQAYQQAGSLRCDLKPI